MKTHEKVRFARLKRGLKQGEVARRIGVPQYRLCDYEKHNYPMPPGSEAKLLRLFGIKTAKEAQGIRHNANK